MIDIPTLITKLRGAPQKVGTFDRGDPKPLDEYRVVLTGEERDWLVEHLSPDGDDTLTAIDQDIGWLKMYAGSMRAENWKDMRNAIENQTDQLVKEIKRLKRTSGEG